MTKAAKKTPAARPPSQPVASVPSAETAQLLEALRAFAAQHGHHAPTPAAGTAATRPQDAGQQSEDRSGSARVLWRDHRAVIAPYGWMSAAEVLACTGHYAAHGTAQAAIAAAGAAVAGTWALVRGKGRPAGIKRYLAAAWALGTAWTATAALWTPIGPHGAMQLALVGGGLATAAPHLWRHRNQRRPARPAALELPPPPDPRLEAFRLKFCRSGAMKDASLEFGEVPDGFAVDLKLAEHSDGTTDDVVQARKKIAKMYDVPVDQVSVEYGAKRSEARARVTVLTADNALERDQPWDGTSTYDPATGRIDLGRFLDSRTAHWLLHKPGNGAAGGVVAGAIGSGKTGSTHIIACEAAQARQCAVCGAAGTCQRCDMQRIAAIWMGDPQMQPFGVWRGRADVTAWGPEACVSLLAWGKAAMRARARHFGELEWTDHLGRVNHGKGWFDPSPQYPLIYIVIDEWPLIVSDPVLGPIAKQLASDIAKEGRKVGIALVFLTQIPDLTELGVRAVREMLKAFNTLAHRTDGLSKYMLGVEGDPSALPAGVHGTGFLNGPDNRPAATMRTKHLPEYLQPGQAGIDVRELAGRIAVNPVSYDPAVLGAITPLGYTGPLQVVGGDGAEQPSPPWRGSPDAMHWTPGPEDPGPAGAELLAGPASLDAVSRVQRALAQHGGDGAEIYDLMEATGLSALEASRATAALVTSGDAVQDGDRYLIRA